MSRHLTSGLFLALLWGAPVLASASSGTENLAAPVESAALSSETALPVGRAEAWSDGVLDLPSTDAPRLIADPWGPLHERFWFIRTVRLGIGTLAGAGGAIVGLFPGGLLGLLASIPLGYLGAPVGVALGAGVGAVFGTWLSGNLLGGDGSFWGTLVGTALGGIGTYALSFVTMWGSIRMGPLWLPSVVISVLAPFLGGALGYELTSRTSAAAPRDSGSATFGLEHARVAPALLPGRDGAAIGFALSGSFR